MASISHSPVREEIIVPGTLQVPSVGGMEWRVTVVKVGVELVLEGKWETIPEQHQSKLVEGS